MNEALNRIRTQIIWDRLLAVVEEQAQTLVRTAFSTSTREAGDLSAGLFDRAGRMVTQAVTGTPGHVNAMAASVGFFLEHYPLADMHEGDVYVTNDPWMGTGHLHDFTVVTPVIRNGSGIGLFASTSHVVDVGGLGFSADGREVYEEGLNVPIMPLFERGRVNDFLMRIVRANVREAVQVEGDLYSLAACNDIGAKRLLETMDEFGLDDIDEVSEHIISTSRASMLAAIQALPRGTFKQSMRVDGHEREIDLVATLTISESGIDVDFDGTSSVSTLGINVPITYTQAYASFGVRCVVGANIPNNAGSLEPVRVTAPPGSILNAPPPCGVCARHVTGQMLPDVVLGCLHQVDGLEVPAEGASSLWNPLLMNGALGQTAGGNSRNAQFAVNIFHSGGTGARPGQDGLSSTAFPSGVRNTPVEISETIAPLVIRRKEYRTDSGGAGRHRGGLGQDMEIAHADDAPYIVSAMFDRVANPARGRSGGLSGAAGVVRLSSGALLATKGRQDVPPMDSLHLGMPGGGGLGCPTERAAQAVAEDVRDGLVSVSAARELYRVACDEAGNLDTRQTDALRGEP
ncbi:MAG: hydantoinase B/oxoprolinase family protein [Chromatiales bacterium]|jgi:N-methylhydantoinase B|nr:hydantoinase B/oxoprolinase family protein [Chromatiales bacterium]